MRALPPPPKPSPARRVAPAAVAARDVAGTEPPAPTAPPAAAAIPLAPPPARGTRDAAPLARATTTPGRRPHEVMLDRAEAGRPDMRSSGARFLKHQLREMRRLVARGVPCRVVFDLDNTLFDTRARTLHVLRSFDAERVAAGRPPLFSGVGIDDVGLDARDTCARLRASGREIPDEDVEALHARWSLEFWSAEGMAHDLPMPEVLRWAEAARAVGAEVLFLTGRSQKLPDGSDSGFAEASLAQLHRAGLSFVKPEHLHLKPEVSVRTAQFKAERMKAFGQDAYVGFFLTEGRRDVAIMEALQPRTPCVLLDCSLEQGGEDVPAHVPVLARVF